MFILLIIVTSIWVVVDAKSIGVKRGQINGLGNLGPWGWFFTCLLLWIVGFPLYLAKRGEFKRVNLTSGEIDANLASADVMALPTKTIRETRCTCGACGSVWYYGKVDVIDSADASFRNLGKSMMCCGGCIPAMFIPDLKPIDLGKCSKCGSRAVKQEGVEHELP